MEYDKIKWVAKKLGREGGDVNNLERCVWRACLNEGTLCL